jgi:hypothetical protein
MKKLPTIHLTQIVPFGLALSFLGFCLILTESHDLMNLGAILLSLGFLPAAVVLSRYETKS